MVTAKEYLGFSKQSLRVVVCNLKKLMCQKGNILNKIPNRIPEFSEINFWLCLGSNRPHHFRIYSDIQCVCNNAPVIYAKQHLWPRPAPQGHIS